jgi:hypothetical protein
MYLTLAGIKWPLKDDENVLVNQNFRASCVPQFLSSSVWDGVTDDLTDTELLDACGILNEHFRNQQRDPSAGVLCLSAQAGIVPSLDFIVVPVKCPNGAWYVFAYEPKNRLLYVSNNRVEYSVVSVIVSVLQAHTGSSGIRDFVSLNYDNAHNSAAASLVLMMALLKSWHRDASLQHVEDYLTGGNDTHVSWRGRHIAYADVLPGMLRAAWAAPSSAPVTNARTRGCVYNDMFDLI